MPVKKCALCLETRELCDSHFLSAGFYRILHDESEINKNPVLVNKTCRGPEFGDLPPVVVPVLMRELGS